MENCVDTCNNTEKKYDYLSECVSSCQKAKYRIEYLLKCADICPISTYINDKDCEKCHPDCKDCNGPFNDTNSNCTSCISPEKYLENGNCIYKDTDYYTTNEIYLETTKDITITLTTNLINDELTNDIKTPIETTILNCESNYNNISSLYNINYKL